MSFFGRLEHKAQSRIVALILDATEPAATALEAHAAGFAHTHPVERAVGAGGERLGQHRVQVLGQPRDPQLFRQLVKGVLGEAVALPQGRKGRSAFLCVCLGDGSGHLPGGIGIASGAGGAALPRARRCRTAARLPGANAGGPPDLPRRPGAIRAETSVSSFEGTCAPYVLWCSSASRFSLYRTSIPIIAGRVPSVKRPGTFPSLPTQGTALHSPYQSR